MIKTEKVFFDPEDNEYQGETDLDCWGTPFDESEIEEDW